MGQILANCFSGLSYGLLGSIAGAWVCILASFHSVIISIVRNRQMENKKRVILYISLSFALAYLIGSMLTFSHWSDIISCICAMLFVVTISQEDAGKMRNVMLLSMSLWIFFDFSVGAYTNIITHGATIVSILTAKYRLDRKC